MFSIATKARRFISGAVQCAVAAAVFSALVLSITGIPLSDAQQIIRPIQGGTGVSNANTNTLTLSGGNTITLQTTGATNVTLPTSGTLATTSGLPSFPLAPNQGGTGIANNAAATTTRSGNFAKTETLTNTTSITYPTAGTLATLAGSEALTNKTINGNTITSGSGTLTLAASKTLTASNTLTLTATDGSTAAFGGGGTVTYTVASGAKALATSAISSASCTSAQTDTATGTATTDAIIVTFNGDPTAVTGYVPLTTGMLTIIPYPTANTVNFKVCNNTSASITPGAVTLNWRVVR